MKKYIIPIILGCTLALSCESLYEPKTIEEVSDENMWVVPDMARGVLMQAYVNMPNRFDSFDGNSLDVATGDAVTNSFNAAIYRLSQGCLSSTNNPLSMWGTAYEQFQNIHLFLNKGLGDKTVYAISSTEADEEAKRQLYAEAYYLRAWWGAYLLQYYGGRTLDGQALGYPIVTEFVSQDEADDFDNIKRNTYEECVTQICNDCDVASAILPSTPATDYWGRATSLMAEFLKARVLFLAANPAYQSSEIVNLNGIGDYEIVDKTAYEAKWTRAIDQIYKVMTLSGVTTYTALQRTDIVDMNQNSPVTPSHFIFRYYFQDKAMENRHFPPFYYGGAQTQPSKNLVDAFPMKANGYPIDHVGSGYNEQDPYTGRDNRLDFTVYHQGSEFSKQGNTDFSSDPVLQDSVRTYIDVSEGGKDSQAFMNGNSRGSRTGYYLHKFLSEKYDMLDPAQTVKAMHFYPTMRMAEMFFDLAEALNEVVGPKGTYGSVPMTAYDIIKTIRQKAGGIANDLYIEEVSGTKDNFLPLILNERRLEFAFENFRYWDIRRRLLPMSETVYGTKITNNGGALTYSSYEVETRDFDNVRFYYLPLPYNEVQKNPNGMIQNMDY